MIEAGNSFEIGDLTIHAREANDSDAIEEVAYVIEHELGTFLHAGVTRTAPETFPAIAEEFRIDLRALAFGSVGNIYEPETDTVKRT